MDSIKKVYKERAERYRGMSEHTGKKLLFLSLMRLFVFIAGVALLIILWNVNQAAAVASFVAALIIFIFLLRRYAYQSFRKSFFENLQGINEKELRGLDNDQSPFDGGEEYINPHHDFSHDIDLFGDNSLYQYLNRTCTGRGRDLLAEWLSSPSALSSDMEKRQEAVRELAPMVAWRQEFSAYGMMGMTGQKDIDDFSAWLREKPYYLYNTKYRILRFLMPALALSTLMLAIAGILHYSFFILFFLINLAIISINMSVINHKHAMVTKKHNMLKTVRNLVSHFEDQAFKSSYIIRLQKSMTAGSESASLSIKRLSKIIQAFDSRLNMLMAIPLSGILLWDIQCIFRLESWKQSASDLLSEWFENLGHTDALCSLANFAGNNEHFCYPLKSRGDTYLRATEMGHPLIPSQARVTNDFTMADRGEINIITGANMAGKSTFLRTVAVNMVLALAGAPVCAESFTFTPCDIYSSMRTTDSLSDSESYFYAELKRLGELKERLERRENIFFLLDEILKGTNSKDKSEGARIFIEKITEYRATGIIATHDILLGRLEENYKSIKNRCFEIEIEGDQVKFDYILRDGIAEKMNAAILMRQMGII
jgi:DNA mismatch repair ATPase MutS